MMRTRWEYSIVTITPPETVVDLLKQLGHAGWEAWHMSATGKTIYFKRPIVIAQANVAAQRR